jgi:hypothetical protein
MKSEAQAAAAKMHKVPPPPPCHDFFLRAAQLEGELVSLTDDIRRKDADNRCAAAHARTGN